MLSISTLSDDPPQDFSTGAPDPNTQLSPLVTGGDSGGGSGGTTWVHDATTAVDSISLAICRIMGNCPSATVPGTFPPGYNPYAVPPAAPISGTTILLIGGVALIGLVLVLRSK